MSQCAAAVALSVLVPLVQPVRINPGLSVCPGWDGRPLQTRERPVLCLSAQSEGKWLCVSLWKDHRAPFLWSPKCLVPRLVLQRTVTKSLCWLQPERGWGVMHTGLVA